MEGMPAPASDATLAALLAQARSRARDLPIHPRKNPRGRPFQKGEGGRPPGATNRRTRALAALDSGDRKAARALVDAALAGDRLARAACFSVLVRPPKDRLPRLPRIRTPAEAAAVLAGIARDVIQGVFSPEEGAKLAADWIASGCASIHRWTSRTTGKARIAP